VKDTQSSERLLDETTLFLHRAIAGDGEASDSRPTSVPGAVLQGRRVLLIDDDVRNIFSLTSALEQYGLEVIFAENGAEGLSLLKSTPDIDAMLVDIMMPGMDGYEVMQEVRRQPAFRNLPVIAVTAKAMVGDREKCMEAGASDYVSKPIDLDQLLATLRVQLERAGQGTRKNGAAHSAIAERDVSLV
jgi:CheY-like chemotaxis protein